MICTQVTKAKIPIVTAGYHHTFLSSTELLINGKWQAGINECKKQNDLICNLFNFMLIRVVKFPREGYKIRNILPKSQHTQRKLLNFENWCSGELSKLANILVSK
jgi:hypothetical protein